MVNLICVRCGVQHAAGARPPARCDICEDEREAVYREGQPWTTLATDYRAALPFLIRPHLRVLCWVVTSDAQAAIARSSTRYLHAIGNA
jgi:hypothetical protein